MRDRLMERLVILPFSVGCISEASVAASVQQPRRSKADAKLRCKEEDDLESLSGESMKNSFGFMVAPKPEPPNSNTTTGIHKLVKGFKNISQLFVYKEDMEEMEREMEMEIGCPTDVKHVTHIGWDGCASATATTSSPVMGWDNLITPDHLLSLPSSSLEPFHLSGPAHVHAHAHHPATLLNAST